MGNVTHEKLSPISLELIVFFDWLTTLLTHASAHVSIQFIRSSSTNDIQELEITKIEYSTQATYSNTLLLIEIRTSHRSGSIEALSLLPLVRSDNPVDPNNQHSDTGLAECFIRDAVPHQHNIHLNNTSIYILLNSAKKNVCLGQILSRIQTEGHTQTVSIDQRFVKSIEIIVTNIFVAEDGFTGCVVKAKTHSYSRQNEFDFSRRITKNSWTELTEGTIQRITGTLILGATRIGDFIVFICFSEKRSEINQKCAVVLVIFGDCANSLFLGVGTFTFIDGFQHINPTGSDKKVGLDTHEVREQSYALGWALSLFYQFETDFYAFYVRADVINVTKSKNDIRFKAGTQLLTPGGQHRAEVGYES